MQLLAVGVGAGCAWVSSRTSRGASTSACGTDAAQPPAREPRRGPIVFVVHHVLSSRARSYHPLQGPSRHPFRPIRCASAGQGSVQPGNLVALRIRPAQRPAIDLDPRVRLQPRFLAGDADDHLRPWRARCDGQATAQT